MRAVPGQQQVGRLRVAMSLGPIARMFRAAQWYDPDNAGGGAVFAGREAAVVENVAREPDQANPPWDYSTWMCTFTMSTPGIRCRIWMCAAT